MKPTRIGIVIAMCLMGAWARAQTPSVALIELSTDPDPNWREQDLRHLQTLRASLASTPGLRLLSQDQQEKLFQEPPDAGAQGFQQKARAHIKRGEAHFSRLRPKKAIKEFKAALRNLKAVFPSLADLSDLEHAHLMLGMTYQALGKRKYAEREYRMVLLLNPDRRLDENRVNPVVVDRFDRVRQRLLTSLKGSISLISRPAGARVLMDGKPVGATPVTIPGVYPGDHYFSMEAAGHKTWFGILGLQPGGLQKREVFLQAGQGIQWVRLRNRLAQAGITKVSPQDAQQLAEGLAGDWLVFASVLRARGAAHMELGIFKKGSPQCHFLGRILVRPDEMAKVGTVIEAWIGGDRTVPQSWRVVKKIPLPPQGFDPDPDPIFPPLPPAPPLVTAWYQSWWFWTTVGLVAAGASAGSYLWLTHDSGYLVEVVR